MTERKSWMPRLDIVFVFTTAFVIVLANSPSPTPMQVVHVDAKVGPPQTYSLAVDDPRLRKLRRRVDTYGQAKPAAALGKARWQAETAAFYAERTLLDHTKLAAGQASDKNGPAVMMVSYVSSNGDTPTKLNLVEYWNDFGAKCSQSIATIEQKWQEQSAELGPPPVSFGEIVPGTINGGTMYVSTVLAIFVTIVMAVWRLCCPARRWPDLQTDNADSTESSELAIVLPRESVKLHQTAMVHLRRVAYVGLLVLAAISLA